jgi:hypothetical protein
MKRFGSFFRTIRRWSGARKRDTDNFLLSRR